MGTVLLLVCAQEFNPQDPSIDSLVLGATEGHNYVTTMQCNMRIVAVSTQHISKISTVELSGVLNVYCVMLRGMDIMMCKFQSVSPTYFPCINPPCLSSRLLKPYWPSSLVRIYTRKCTPAVCSAWQNSLVCLGHI